MKCTGHNIFKLLGQGVTLLSNPVAPSRCASYMPMRGQKQKREMKKTEVKVASYLSIYTDFDLKNRFWV